MKKVTYLALHLGFGGVEKAIINQANILSDFCEVEIISAYRLFETPPFEVDQRVKIRYLMEDKPNKEELKQAIQQKNLKQIWKESIHAVKVLSQRTSLMKKAVKECNADIIISSRYLYNRILTKNARKGVITIAQEHCHHNNDREYIKKLVKSVAHMDYFMPVSKELTNFYSEKLKGTNVECVYIPHNLDYWPDTVSTLTEKKFVSVGRLSPEKGFGELVEVMAPLLKEHPDWSLHIIGDGVERNAIQNKIDTFGLNQQIKLYGYQEKSFVNQMLATSSIYVMASLEESFGIVLIEAQSYGLPCVAFDSAQGANEIIAHNQTGYLVPNRDAVQYREYVKKLMDDFELRTAFGQKARVAAEQYKQDVVKTKWTIFINSITKKD